VVNKLRKKVKAYKKKRRLEKNLVYLLISKRKTGGIRK